MSDKVDRRTLRRIDDQRVRDLIGQHPHASNHQLARMMGCGETAIRQSRKRLGLPASSVQWAPVAQVKWGNGRPKLVRPATKETTERVVSISDIHFPYHDVRLCASALELIADVKPHRVIINGDVNDFFGLSRFNTSLERLDMLQDEIDQANAYREAIRDAAPDAVIDETEGNHDSRIVTYLRQNAPAMRSLRALDPASLFRYDELGINFHPGCGFLLRENFLVRHGTMVRSEAGASAKAEFMSAGISGMSGHVHRLATYRKAGHVQRQWTEQGGLMRLDPDYVTGIPNWQQGCVVGEFSTKTNSFVIHEVPAVDGHLRLGLKSY